VKNKSKDKPKFSKEILLDKVPVELLVMFA
jgi:hypothetical protein